MLEVRGLTHRFGGLVAISDFNLELRQGELVGVIGPNGAGKTTLFNLLTGLYKPVAGEISIEGRAAQGLSPHRIVRMGVARTFQNIRLFREMTVLDNVRAARLPVAGSHPFRALLRLPGFRDDERAVIAECERLLAMFGLQAHAHRAAGGLAYGQQRRLEIARALATRPRLLLLDEPAAGMNPREVDDLMRMIRWVRDEFGCAILLIEHHMKLVMNVCSRLKVLDFGKTIAEGTPAEVQAHAAVREAYLGQEDEE